MNESPNTSDLSGKRCLITGGAGFIGSNLTKRLLEQGAQVIIVDNLSTGNINNLKDFEGNRNFLFIRGDIADAALCIRATEGVDYVFHQAALGSVPRSIEDPLATNEANITGFLNVLNASVHNRVKRFIFAASSSVYGDSQELPKKENNIGRPLSPYAVTKLVNELYAEVFGRVYGIDTIGLRYFNVFGPKQNPAGPYAAVIPLFIKKILAGESPVIHGDGEQTRDFTYIDNVVQANIKAAQANNPQAVNEVYNIAAGERTSLNTLLNTLKELTDTDIEPEYSDPRKGDVKDSLADISRAKEYLDYQPEIFLKNGLKKTINFFREENK